MSDYQRLAEVIGPDSKLDEPMWRHTSFRVGGPASLFVRARGPESLRRLMPVIASSGLPWRVLGGGTNVLVADTGVRAVIVSTDAGKVELNPLREEVLPDGVVGVVVLVAAGSKLATVARRAAEQGLSGLEWAIGVPGSVGGAVVNNAGAHGSDLAAVFEAANVVDEAGKVHRLGPGELRYRYRDSAFKAGALRGLAIASAELRLRRSAPEVVREVASRFDQMRKERQPTGLSAGSVFKNPPGDYSGRLVETAGLKGTRVGGAQVSELHGNFFLNMGGATALDLYQLARLVQDAVWGHHGVWLEPEVELLGEWTDDQRRALLEPRSGS